MNLARLVLAIPRNDVESVHGAENGFYLDFPRGIVRSVKLGDFSVLSSGNVGGHREIIEMVLSSVRVWVRVTEALGRF
jgi:hypothetical protein